MVLPTTATSSPQNYSSAEWFHSIGQALFFNLVPFIPRGKLIPGRNKEKYFFEYLFQSINIVEYKTEFNVHLIIETTKPTFKWHAPSKH